MEQKAGAQISRKSFLQSVLILFVLMLAAGALSHTVPAGMYVRSLMDGREIIDPNSFQLIEKPDYPFWRWFIAPLEVLTGPDGLTLIVIIIFILMVGSSFAVLDKAGILKAGLGKIVKRLGDRKYLLLMVISFLFMLIGAFLGIFEEVVPLIPIMLALSYMLGWDSLVGLGMSILATNMGFSAAVTNPFTIGIAQKIAGLPLFSGAWLRVIVFIVVYAVFMLFLGRYARKIDRHPGTSPVYEEDQIQRTKYAGLDLDSLAAGTPHLGRGMLWFGVFVILIFLLLAIAPLVPALSDISLPLVGLLFLIGGVGAGLISGSSGRIVWRAAWEGLTGIAPGVPLILMAASIKFIVAQGGVMDTILYNASQTFEGVGAYPATLVIFFLALFIEFFIGSGSAKALLMMPILLPLADLVGVTRQIVVTAYCFGDGFSNLAYPTNPVLLISLGLTVVSYPKWLRWTLKLWLWILLVSVVVLGLAVAIQYGPF